MVLVATLSSAGQAAEEIIDPTADPTETWHYGLGANNQTVTFSYNEPPPLSSITISIVVKDNPAEELFSQSYTPPFNNPHSTDIIVPLPYNDSEECIVRVTLYPMSPDPPRTLSQDVNIKKP